MFNHIKHASNQEIASFFADDIVAYVQVLYECEDYVTLSNVKKPSLSDYDVVEV